MSDRSFFEPERPLAPVQWAAIAGSLVVLFWSIPGLIVNPDFATGDAATAELVLGVDMNGWHAASGFLVAVPGFFAALRRDWAGLFNVAAAGSLIATGIWALADAHVAGGLFYLPEPARRRAASLRDLGDLRRGGGAPLPLRAAAEPRQQLILIADPSGQRSLPPSPRSSSRPARPSRKSLPSRPMTRSKPPLP